MQAYVDRPTAVANAMAAAVADVADPFDEEHPGPDLLKLESTTRNRFKKAVKRDKTRNLTTQRIYDGTFYVVYQMLGAVRAHARRMLPFFSVPIRPYNNNEGQLNADATSFLIIELANTLGVVVNAVLDALCAVCEAPLDLPTPVQSQPPQRPPGPVAEPEFRVLTRCSGTRVSGTDTM